eukprot:34383-Rhodomonas_salina.1
MSTQPQHTPVGVVCHEIEKSATEGKAMRLIAINDNNKTRLVSAGAVSSPPQPPTLDLKQKAQDTRQTAQPPVLLFLAEPPTSLGKKQRHALDCTMAAGRRAPVGCRQAEGARAPR